MSAKLKRPPSCPDVEKMEREICSEVAEEFWKKTTALTAGSN